MRPWPVLQFCVVVLLLGMALLTLRGVIRSSESRPIDSNPENVEPDAVENLITYLQFEFSEPVEPEEIYWGSRLLEPISLSPGIWTAKIDGPLEPLRIEGTASAKQLPLALRIEMETDGLPTREKVYWIRQPEFSITYRPESP